MSCAIWLHIVILSFGITAVSNQDIEPITTVSTTPELITTELRTTEVTTTETISTEASITEAITTESAPPVATTAATTESPTDDNDDIDEDEYTPEYHEFCISYDDECENGLMMVRLHSQGYSKASHFRAFLRKSKLLAKLTGTVKPPNTQNSTVSKSETVKTTV